MAQTRSVRLPSMGSAPAAKAGVQPSDAHYLWILVLLEFGALWGLRSGFRRHHGG